MDEAVSGSGDAAAESIELASGGGFDTDGCGVGESTVESWGWAASAASLPIALRWMTAGVDGGMGAGCGFGAWTGAFGGDSAI